MISALWRPGDLVAAPGRGDEVFLAAATRAGRRAAGPAEHGATGAADLAVICACPARAAGRPARPPAAAAATPIPACRGRLPEPPLLNGWLDPEPEHLIEERRDSVGIEASVALGSRSPAM